MNVNTTDATIGLRHCVISNTHEYTDTKSDTRGGESPTANQPTVQKHRGEPDTRDRHTILTNHRKTNLRAHSSVLTHTDSPLTRQTTPKGPHPNRGTRPSRSPQRHKEIKYHRAHHSPDQGVWVYIFLCIVVSVWFPTVSDVRVIRVRSLYARVVRHDRFAIVRFAVSARPMPDGSQTLPIRRLRLRFWHAVSEAYISRGVRHIV